MQHRASGAHSVLMFLKDLEVLAAPEPKGYHAENKHFGPANVKHRRAPLFLVVRFIDRFTFNGLSTVIFGGVISPFTQPLPEAGNTARNIAH